MSKVNGLASFLRKEHARKLSGSKLMKAKRPEAVSFQLVDGKMKPLDDKKGKRFRLPETQEQLLARAADPKCFRCHGKGISKWDRRGEHATVCACVRRRAAALEEALQFQKEQMERMLAEAKAELKSEPPLQDPNVGTGVPESMPVPEPSLWDRLKKLFVKEEPPVVAMDFGAVEPKVLVLEKVPEPEPGYKVVSVEDVERMERADEGGPAAVPAEAVSEG